MKKLSTKERNDLIKEGERRMLKKLALLALIIIAFVIVAKVTGPLVNQFILGDNQNYVEKYGNPSNWEAKDNAYLERVAYNNSLLSSSDFVIKTFFNANALIRGFVYIAALAVVVLTIVGIYYRVKRVVKRVQKNISKSTKAKRA